MKIRRSADGMHMFNRRTGINILLDEIQFAEADWDKAPRFVSFAITNLCDLHCPFCYAPKQQATLDRERILRWCSELDRGGCLGIGFGGGEPTLHPDFAFLCQQLYVNTALSIGFTTHAHRIDDRLANALSGRVHFIRVSMDGVGQTYESIRRRPFDQFIKKIKIVSEISYFGINYVVNSATIDDLDEATTLALELGAQEFLLLPEQSEKTLCADVVDRLNKWIASWRSTMRLAVSYHGVTDAMPLAEPFVRDVGTRAYMHVNALGQLVPNSYEQEDAVQIDLYSGILEAQGAFR